MQITYCHHHDVGQLSSTRLHGQESEQQRTWALPQLAEMETQTSTSVSELSVGLQNINNINKLSRLFYYYQLDNTNFLFIHTNYIKLNSSTCFERNLPIIRRSTTQIVHMQPLVSSLSASDRLVQLLRKDFLSGFTRRSLAESADTRGCIRTICVVDLLMMGGLRSKHVEEFNFM